MLDISCELSFNYSEKKKASHFMKQMIHMKCQDLFFSRKYETVHIKCQTLKS